MSELFAFVFVATAIGAVISAALIALTIALSARVFWRALGRYV